MALDPYAGSAERRHSLVALTRRAFLLLMGGITGMGALLFGGIETAKFLFPNATGEAPLKFKLTVDPKQITVDNPLMDYGHRTGIIRDDAGLYAVQLICTHLGCTPNYVTNVTNGSGLADNVAESHGVRRAAERVANGWACPCHGSRYFIDSTNFYGPAPRPMDWVDLQFGPDGTSLVVDRGTLVVQRGAGDITVPLWRLDPSTKKDNGRTYGV